MATASLSGSKRKQDDRDADKEERPRNEAEYKAAVLLAANALQKPQSAPETGEQGDWKRYQPPSAVLEAVKQSREEEAAKPLPPALAARLRARGIVTGAKATSKEEPEQAANSGRVATSEQHNALLVTTAPIAMTSCPPARLPPGWYSTIDPRYNAIYYFNPGTGQRTWEIPQPLPLVRVIVWESRLN